MRARLSVLPYTDKELRERSGMKHATWENVKGARRPGYHRKTLLQVDRTVGWTDGSAQRVLDGLGEPTVDPERDAELMRPAGERIVRAPDYIITGPDDGSGDDAIIAEVYGDD